MLYRFKRKPGIHTTAPFLRKFVVTEVAQQTAARIFASAPPVTIERMTPTQRIEHVVGLGGSESPRERKNRMARERRRQKALTPIKTK